MTRLLEQQPDNLEAVQKAVELQDNINNLYDRQEALACIYIECVVRDRGWASLAEAPATYENAAQ